jgi:hypothetical protein
MYQRRNSPRRAGTNSSRARRSIASCFASLTSVRVADGVVDRVRLAIPTTCRMAKHRKSNQRRACPCAVGFCKWSCVLLLLQPLKRSSRRNRGFTGRRSVLSFATL